MDLIFADHRGTFRVAAKQSCPAGNVITPQGRRRGPAYSRSEVEAECSEK